MQVELYNWIIGIFPMILLILLMAILHWTTTKAAGITLLFTIISSLLVFQANTELVVFESLKGLWNAVTILWIIFPAMLMYEVIAEAGCIDALNEGMKKISPNELFKILTIGWVFAGFLQGITGFGVPVAICVPILIGFGVSPTIAVVISLLGQAWGNTFGTLAVAWDVLVDISGISGNAALETARYASVLLWILNLASALAICWLYGRIEGVKQGLPFVLVISAIHGGGELIVSQLNQSIAAFIPSTAAMAAVLILSRCKRYREEYQINDSPIMIRKKEVGLTASAGEKSNMLVAFSPYLVLIVVTIVLLVIKPVNVFLRQWSWGFAFPETCTAYGFTNSAIEKYSPFYPFVDSGTVLMITAVISYFLLRKAGCFEDGAAKRILRRAYIKVKPSATSIAFLLIISKLMSGSGQTLLIAKGMTLALGDKYVLLAGFLGLIGSFITGSNMSSNILFTDVQVSAAANLGINSAALLAAQTSASAAGSMISPSKIVLGATSANALGKEGEILKMLLPVSMMITLLIGIICWLLI